MPNKILDISSRMNGFNNSGERLRLPAKKTILTEGKISQNINIIEEGCVRLWFNNDGKDVTFQFFFEGDAVSSIESFKFNQPSLFSIETLEPCTIVSLNKSELQSILESNPKIKEEFEDFIYRRLIFYQKLFLSRIKDIPQKRYEDLIKKYPHIVQRVPQHYIASYLGITSVSLSRIRNRR